MTDSADDPWSAVAEEWALRWGPAALPAALALLDAAGVGVGTRLLDAGCGSGELLRLAVERGAVASGADPSIGMLELAGRLAPAADLRLAGLEALPWPDGAFDVVTAVNALHLADDDQAALREVRRVLGPGGVVGIASWAEHALNDLDALEAAVAEADGEEPAPDLPERLPGGLEALLAAAGFAVLDTGLVATPWEAEDEEALVAAVLLGEDPATLAELGPAVLTAAAPFRTPEGGYRLRTAFRWAVARA
jgi:SAM-dependent methyltransferase